MAPNNALADSKKKNTKNVDETSRTTVLEPGTVEGRGIGTNIKSNQIIENEIQAFLIGEGKLSIHSETRSFFTVFTFITRLPGPTWTDHHPGFLMRGMCYFPVVGLLVGIFVSVFFDVAHVVFGLPLIVSAVMSTAASLWVTGCFHEDGLADSSDGIGGGWSRQQILTIMTDTRLGTYGCAVLLLYMVGKLQLLAAQGPSQWTDDTGYCKGAGPALLVSHTVSRMVSAYMIRTRDYVDESGPKYKFYKFMVNAKHLVSWERVVVAALFSAFVVTILYGPIVSAIMILLVLLGGHFAGAYGEYLLGGVMGDFLGATICVTEVLCLTILYTATHYGVPTSLSMEETMAKLQNVTIYWENIRDMSHPLGVLARFAIVIFLTVVWSCNVGHPNVLVRETVAKAQDEEIDTEGIRVTFESMSTKFSSSSARLKAEQSISRNESSFSERYETARLYLDTLAKPMGSLGTLEDWIAKIAALQCTTIIEVDPVACIIFAADHGAAKSEESGGVSCSAYPQAVTRSVLEGLKMGIAGASVLAKENKVQLRVVDVGVAGEPCDGGVVYSSKLKLTGGTGNICSGNAMTITEAQRCISIGRRELRDVKAATKARIMILGEVGIGNTTSTSALIAMLTSASIDEVCGGGATTSRNVENSVIQKKIGIVRQAIKKNSSWYSSKPSPMNALALVGGAEIAALVGAFLECSERNVPVLCDGFIVTTAAMIAVLMDPLVCRILLLSTASAEPGHKRAVAKIMEVAKTHKIPMSDPALAMGLRMGEATAALLAVPILRSAAAVAKYMGTIQDILKE